jgi:hypothetical protein
MLPSSTEVLRSMRGAWRLMEEGERALTAFDMTQQGLVRSFGAFLLTLPAVVALIAAERLRHGLSNEAGLFADAAIAASIVALQLLSFVLAPALIVALFWRVARTARGTGFLIAWNWTEVIVALVLAVPAALFAAGLVNAGLALLMTAAFGVIALRLRYAVARSALGLAAPMAVGVAVLAFAVQFGAAWTLALVQI